MTLWTPEAIDAARDLSELDRRLAQVPDRRAVFLIAPRQGAPYIGRTALLHRRLQRLLGERSQPSRLLSLRSVTARVEFQLTASWLETSLVFYEVARAHFPEDYLSRIKLHMPPYVKILLSNRFPRSLVTTRLDASRSLYYGPFRTRASADQFEAQFLDLFQMRRCHEDLEPSPDHPGCVYGEMNLCLRPCQQAVSVQEYASEIELVVRFLSTDGRSLLDTASHARERASRETDFELAARLHKQVEKVDAVLKLRDGLVSEVSRLSGVAVTASVAVGCVELWFLLEGRWLPPVRFPVQAVGEKAVSLDTRLRGVVGGLERRRLVARERQEHLALLARWYYSGGRDGEWLPFAALSDLPYRRLVRAISRTAVSGGSACHR
jgi:excinuclease UvrABC nuclease subunit